MPFLTEDTYLPPALVQPQEPVPSCQADKGIRAKSQVLGQFQAGCGVLNLGSGASGND